MFMIDNLSQSCPVLYRLVPSCFVMWYGLIWFALTCRWESTATYFILMRWARSIKPSILSHLVTSYHGMAVTSIQPINQSWRLTSSHYNHRHHHNNHHHHHILISLCLHLPPLSFLLFIPLSISSFKLLSIIVLIPVYHISHKVKCRTK